MLKSSIIKENETEAGMQEQIIRLIYPPHLTEVPVIHQLIRQFDLTVNITRADLSAESRWIEVKISGHKQVIEEATAWLKSTGLQLLSTEEN
jgi:ABC-type methionine transport system ATPase subunit